MKTNNLFLILLLFSFFSMNINAELKGTNIEMLSKYREMIYAFGSNVNKIEIEKEPHLVRSIILYPPFSDRDMAILKLFENLEELEIRSPEVTDEGLKTIPELKKITNLNLKDLPITDEGIKNLSTSKSLEHMELEHTAITDRVFKYLRQLPSLKSVHFGMIEDRGDLDEKEIRKLFAFLEKRARKKSKSK